MVFRLFDWECSSCLVTREDLVHVPSGERAPDAAILECPHCSETVEHTRMLSLPARYLYDKPFAPAIVGGRFDTMGGRRPPPLPELPPDADFNDARDRFHSREYKERLKENWNVRTENANKRKRAAAMKKHPTMDIRNTPLPGDPKMS